MDVAAAERERETLANQFNSRESFILIISQTRTGVGHHLHNYRSIRLVQIVISRCSELVCVPSPHTFVWVPRDQCLKYSLD